MDCEEVSQIELARMERNVNLVTLMQIYLYSVKNMECIYIRYSEITHN
jgi:hypothetical protein